MDPHACATASGSTTASRSTPMAVKRSLDGVLQDRPVVGRPRSQLYDRVDVIDPRTVPRAPQDRVGAVPVVAGLGVHARPGDARPPDEGTLFPIGTGPFRFVDWQVNKRAQGDPQWNGYWRKDRNGDPLPHLDGIEFRPVRGRRRPPAGAAVAASWTSCSPPRRPPPPPSRTSTPCCGTTPPSARCSSSTPRRAADNSAEPVHQRARPPGHGACHRQPGHRPVRRRRACR